MTYRQGSSRSYPWGVETDIHIEDGKTLVRTVTVTKWPKGELDQAVRGARLIANCEADMAEQDKPEPVMVPLADVEKVLAEKGLITVNQKYADFVASAVKLVAPIEEAVK